MFTSDSILSNESQNSPIGTEMEVSDTKILTFLGFPAELRNKIYRLYLTRGTFCIYTCAGRPWSTVPDLYCASQLLLCQLRANRQIHPEAASILYRENNFAFPDPIRCTWDLHNWLKQIGPDSCRFSRKVNISPPIIELHREMFAAFVECSKLLKDAVDLELPLDTPNSGGSCRKIIIRLIGSALGMAWMESDSMQADLRLTKVHGTAIQYIHKAAR